MRLRGPCRLIGADCQPPPKEAVIVAVWSPAIVAALAIKVADVEPGGIVTDAGGARAAVLLEIPTVPPPAFERVTVQVVVPPLLSVAGAHASEMIVAGATIETDAVCDAPFSEAVIVTVSSSVTAPAVTENVAVVEPAATGTEPGTIRPTLLLEIATVPPVALANVSVHVPPPRGVSEGGEQTSEVMERSTTSERFTVCEDPLMDAVTVAVWLFTTVPAVTVKVADMAPGATEIELGVVTSELLDRDTAPPAVLDSVTVHPLTPPLLKPVGEQTSDWTLRGAVRLTEADCVDPFSEAMTVAV
jgi:hypothetical protein